MILSLEYHNFTNSPCLWENSEPPFLGKFQKLKPQGGGGGGSNYVDISKILDRVWHEKLIYKIESVDISGPLIKLIEKFLSNIYQ